MSDTSDLVAMSEIARFATEVRRVLEVTANGCPDSVGNPLSTLRVRAALDSTALLAREPEGRLTSSMLSVIRDDLRRMVQVLTPHTEQLGPRDLVLAGMIGDHIVDSISLEYAIADQVRLHSGVHPTVQRLEAYDALLDVAARYGDDAKAETRVMLAVYGVSVAMSGVGAVIACLGLDRADGARAFRLSQFAAYGLVGLGFAVAGIAGVWLAGRHRRGAREARRLQRQLIGFDAWVAPIPDPLQAILRAIVAEQLFPRLIEDDEPWRRSKWPSAEDCVKLLESRGWASPSA